MPEDYIIYYRVSTKKQGDSGLGLAAQKAYINHFLTPEQIQAEFTEVQSGKNIQQRPVLQQAIEYCIQHNCTLAVAKIDRLSRKTEDALWIYEQLKGKLYSCDIPNLDKFTLTLFMAMADRERELIGIRTKQALDAKKAQCGEWRNSTFSKAVRDKGIQAIQQKSKSNPNNQRAMQIVILYKEKGWTLQAIAKALNQNGFRTSTNKLFHKTTVKRLWDRHKKSKLLS
jgi:DNA invertase Pin-like site-specific DNA recombinase